ncbi:hypothetical protein NDU88_005887 [Pleurodeles waltl]|uniref:Uncharacterized protein n=1 Tax=Pleurodeles waltl TaxID=8319 RepID=A0AAV7PLR9_PLEWA|nr:hypothetical protein NDU88_005887 [Pleurodeles waltl]
MGLPLQAVTHNVVARTTRRSAVVESCVLATQLCLVPDCHTRTSSPRGDHRHRQDQHRCRLPLNVSVSPPVPQSRSRPTQGYPINTLPQKGGVGGGVGSPQAKSSKRPPPPPHTPRSSVRDWQPKLPPQLLKDRHP